MEKVLDIKKKIKIIKKNIFKNEFTLLQGINKLIKLFNHLYEAFDLF